MGTMRGLIIACSWFVLCAPVYGQARTEARRSIDPDIDLARYKVTRVGGEIFYVVSFTEKPPWYIFTDVQGTKRNMLKTSVAKIEPLDEETALKVAENAPTAHSSFGTNLYNGPRIEARVKARVAARKRPPGVSPSSSVSSSRPRASLVAPSDEPIDQSRSNVGTTATGIPLHVGPRGGVYHYSASGRKVYSSRK
jgi:hypothetical protein